LLSYNKYPRVLQASVQPRDHKGLCPLWSLCITDSPLVKPIKQIQRKSLKCSSLSYLNKVKRHWKEKAFMSIQTQFTKSNISWCWPTMLCVHLLSITFYICLIEAVHPELSLPSSCLSSRWTLANSFFQLLWKAKLYSVKLAFNNKWLPKKENECWHSSQKLTTQIFSV
jgi:hypothetical protein